MWRRWSLWLIWAGLILTGCHSGVDKPTSSVSSTHDKTAIALTIAAAASLRDVLNAIQPVYESAHPNVTLIVNSASSGALQQQIEQGAPVDVFLSASPHHMDALEQKGLLIEGSRRNVLENSIVLVVPQAVQSIATFDDLESNEITHVAIGNPESVPAGHYSRELLETLDLYPSIQSKLIFAQNVRQVLAYVETGNVDAGLVYHTDAQTSAHVRVVASAPTNTHTPIVYPVAAIANRPHPNAAIQFTNFLATEEAIAIFQNYGFRPAH